MVYVLAGHCIEVATDFILGHGRPRARGKNFSLPSPSVRQGIAREVEQAFMEAPSSGLVALIENPAEHFEFDDLLSAHKYIMEHSLCRWIYHQNHDCGVAPSRDQILTQAVAGISLAAPEQVQAELRKAVSGAPRKQRRWLARFRKRWGAKIGMLRPQEDVSIDVRKQKVRSVSKFGFFNNVYKDGMSGVIFGSANQGGF